MNSRQYRPVAPTIIHSPKTAPEPTYGFLFFGLIWVAFSLPNSWWSAFPFVVGHSNLSEMAFLAMPIVYMMYPARQATWHTMQLKTLIVVFFIVSFLGVVFQFIFHGGSPAEYIKTNRIMLPLYTSLALIFLGPRLATKKLLFHFTGALILSFTFTYFVFITGIRPSGFVSTELGDEAFNILRQGRLYNVNSGFGFIAISMVCFAFAARKRFSEKFSIQLLMLAGLITISVSVLSFNRTFLGLSALFFIVASPFVLKPKAIAAVILIMLVGAGAAFVAYRTNETVKSQVDLRIIEPWEEEEMIERMIFRSRWGLYEIYYENLPKYWISGVPPGEVTYIGLRKQEVEANATDISLLTIWWRNGIAAMVFYVLILHRFYMGFRAQFHNEPDGLNSVIAHTLIISLPIMFLASLNIDVLARHFSVVHLALLAISVSGRGSGRNQ